MSTRTYYNLRDGYLPAYDGPDDDDEYQAWLHERAARVTRRTGWGFVVGIVLGLILIPTIIALAGF